MLKLGKTERGVELFSPYKNIIYNLNGTTWEVIKAVKKYGSEIAIKKTASLFEISEKEAKEDIETVLKNLKNLAIDIDNIPTTVPDEIYAPRIVHFDITPKCNSNCMYCLSSDRMSNQAELSTEKILNIIKELNNLGMWVLTVSGGEPLLRKDVFKILDHVKRMNIPIRFFTNGMLIDDLTAEKLSRYKDTMIVQVSLDSSNPKHHDTQRGVNGSFQKTVKGIKNLMKYDVTPIVAAVITPLTLDDIDDTVAFLHDLGINYVRIGNAQLYSYKALSYMDEINLDAEKAKLLGEKINNLSRKYESSMRFSLSPHMMDYAQDPSKSYDLAVCTAGITSLYISSSGDIYPCIALSNPELVIGDVKKDSVVDIWKNSPLLKKLRNLSVNDFEKCKSCTVKNICKGGCRGNSYEYSKSLKSYDPIYCSYFNK